jgi:glyoxylase-like metal-dependent hydrolase (beta-lactamase superfamily II)
MSHRLHLRAGLLAASIAAALTVTVLAQPAPAPAPAAPPAPPLFATTKVDGTEGVYVFRYQGHQAMFIVTPEGVIATDPIGERRPQAVTTYIAEIRKITQAPIRYVVYSHSHYDHIAGGKPFKDAGATFVAHENAKTLLQARKNPDIVIPDETVGSQRTITLGGTSLELNWVGKNHGLDTLIMRLPREKIIFTVDWIPINGIQFRGMADTYIPDLEDSLQKVIAMDWDRMIPGHPGPGGRLGTKDDARAHLQYLKDLSAAVKEAVDAGKNYQEAMTGIKLPKYESWPNYNAFLGMNIERYYDFWNRGI